MNVIGNQVKKMSGLFLAATILEWGHVYAQGPAAPSEASNPLAIVLLAIMLALLLVIGLLGYVLLGAAEFNLKRQQNEKKASVVTQAVVLITLCLTSVSAFAQQADMAVPVAPSANYYGGLAASSYFILIGVIGLELILILVMSYFIKILLAKEKPAVIAIETAYKAPIWQIWWAKMNAFKTEAEVGDTGHNYDGIRELDNKLPPWWLYGFYLTVIFSVVYLYRSQVSHSAPSPLQEYEIAMANAAAEKEEYLKTSASKVDENSVAYLGDAADLNDGKKIFGLSCAPCHGADAQGVVGPNLTDDYWLHQGGLKDIFKIIKYGAPEKGMKAWKDDFSPVQIAQLSSYIKSLHGSKPANAKEPQGELYKDDSGEIASDSTAIDTKTAIK